MSHDLPLSRLRDLTQTHHTRQDSSGRGTYTWHSTLTRDRYPCPLSKNRTRNPRMQAAADPPRGYWDQQSVTCYLLISVIETTIRKNRWLFQLKRGKHHNKFLYIACELFWVQTCPIMVHTGQKQGCLYRSTTPYFAH